MAFSNFRLGDKLIKTVKFGINEALIYLGAIKTYPLDSTIENAIITCDSAIYNGSNQTAQNIVVMLKGIILEQGVDYIISSNTGGTNAGSYDIIVDGIGSYSGTAIGTFIIDVKQVSATVELSQSTYTYNGGECKPIPTVSDGNVVIPSSEYTVTYNNNINVGTAIVTISDNVGGNYEVTGEATFIINKANPTYIAPSATNPTYNGMVQALLNAGSVTGGTIYYSSDNSTWSDTIPTGTNANTYTSYWKITGDSNHNDKASVSISTTISPKTVSSPTITLSQSTYTYANTAFQPTPTVKDGSTTIAISEYTVSYSDNTNVGTAKCTITDKSGGNYIVNGNKTFTIIKVTPTVTAPAPKTLTFNNGNQVLANSGSTDWGVIQYCLNNSGGTYSSIVPSASAANTTYKVWYKVVGDSNINDVSPASIDCMIAEKRVTTPTIVLNPTSYTYNGSACQPTVTVKDGSTVIPASEYTKTFSNNKNAGTATVTITDNEAGNYYISGTTSFVINKASGSVTTVPTENTGLTYNGAAQQLVTAGSGTGTMLYKLDSGSWGTAIPKGTNATSYTVYYKASASTNYNESASGSVSCSIAKVTPTVTAPTAKSLTYNGSAQALVNAGSTNWGTLKYSLDNSTYSTSIPSGTNATSYTVYYKVDGDSNINNVAAKSVAVSIAKANPTYTAPTKKTGLVYNGNNQNLLNAGTTSHGTIKYSSDNSNWSTTIPQGKNANTYSAYWKLEGDSNHNSVASTTISSISIAKVTPTVTAPTKKTLTYSGSAQALYNVGSTNWGTIQYCATSGGTYSTSMITATNAGSYDCWYKVVGDSNINDVAPAKATGTKIGVLAGSISYGTTAVTKTYGNSAFTNALTKTGDGTVTYASNNTTVATVNTSGKVTIKQAGSATITATVADTSNTTYATKTASYTLTVNKASGSVSTAPTATNPDWTGSAQALVTAGSGTGTMLYKLGSGSWGTAIPNGTNASSYTVYYKASASTNYNESASGSVTCSIKKVAMSYKAPSAATRTYNGSAQQIVSGQSATGGSIQFCSTSGGTYTTTVPTQTNYGTSYSTWWKAVPDSNHSGGTSAAQITGCKINKYTPTAPKKAVYTYNGSARALVSGGSTTQGTMVYCETSGGTYSTTIPTATSAGTYDCWWKISGTTDVTSNCNNTAATKVTGCTINKKTSCAISFATTAVTKDYGNAAFTNAITNSGDGTVTWSAGTTSVCTVNTTGKVTIKGAGTCVIKATVANTSNCTYSTTAATYTITVNKVAMSYVAPKAAVRTYNGSAQQIVSGQSATGGSIQFCSTSGGTYSTTVPTQTNYGTSYSTWWKAVPDSNHSGGTSAAQITGCKINKAATCGTAPTAKSLTWTGSAQALLNAGSSTCGTMQYCATASGTYSATIPTGTAATGYTSYWKVANDANHSGTSSGSVSTTIAKKTSCAISFATTAVTKDYGNAAFTNAITNSGDGTVTWSAGTTSVCTVNTTGKVTIKGAGTCVIKATVANTSNCTYSTTAATYTITVNKVAMSYVAPKAAVRTYNGSAQQIVSGQSATGGAIYFATSSAGASSSTTVPTQTNAGSYTTYWKAVPDSNHSGGTSSWASITTTISPKTVSSPTITLSPTGYTYSGSACKPTPTVKDGSTTIASTEYTVSYSNNTNAGTATCTITDKSGGNYTVSGSKTFSIARANRTMSWSSSPSYIEKGQTATATATKTGDGSITYSSSNTGVATINSSSGLITSKGDGSSTITATAGQTTNYNSKSITYSFVGTNCYNEKSYVNLGLPSGVMWATYNLGDTAYGQHYQYGQMGIYQNTSGNTMYTGTESPLSSSKDYARNQWGGQWRIPTKYECEELLSNCTSAFTTMTYAGTANVPGCKFTSKKNGNYIFIPAAGRHNLTGGTNHIGEWGDYWTSTPNGTDAAYYLHFDGDPNYRCMISQLSRNYGFSIRPVADACGGEPL